MVKKKTVLKWLMITCWTLVGAGVTTLLVAAIRQTGEQRCAGLNITIEGVNNHFFVDKQDILEALNLYIDGPAEGQPLSVFNLRSLEQDLAKNIWVKQAQLYFDNNHFLQIRVTEREPVARVFSTAGTSFYIDTSITQLPLSDKLSARLPVFTGFPSDKAVLRKQDSTLLREVAALSLAIQRDSFMMALVEQVDITPERSFELVPKLGEGIIDFGDASDIEEKMQKLKLFYREVMPKSGWDYYSRISIQYKGQVVGRRKGAEDISADSLRTLQLMQLIARTAEDLASDSLQMFRTDDEQNTTNVSLIQQSLQRDDQPEESGAVQLPVQGIPVLPVPDPGKAATPKPAIKKPAVTKANPPQHNTNPVPVKASLPKPKPKPKPKAVMRPQNDY